MSATEMETTKIEIIIPQTCKQEMEEFTDFFQSMTVDEKMDFLKGMRGARLLNGILKARRVS